MIDVTKNLRDAAYVTIGLGVIGCQRAAAQAGKARTRLSSQRVQLDKQFEDAHAQFTKLAKDIEGRFEPVRETAREAQATLRTRLTGAAA